MTLKELIECLQELGFDDDTKVFIEKPIGYYEIGEDDITYHQVHPVTDDEFPTDRHHYCGNDCNEEHDHETVIVIR
ncbi:hypothetical protein C6499_19095 [Candidatus Poribacteria bacterium]|nr:MAG: hypothetical protein C6499_19095 [Candidatus Poribacteria bacterium]